MKHLTEQEKADREAITRNRLRGRSRNFNLRQMRHQHEEDVANDRTKKSEVANTVKIRMHRGSREDSMATVEDISPTFEAVQEYLQRHYAKTFTAEELSIELYARGAPSIDWDYIYLIKCEDGVLAYTDRSIDLKTK